MIILNWLFVRNFLKMDEVKLLKNYDVCFQ